jgi:hypothetical protein
MDRIGLYKVALGAKSGPGTTVLIVASSADAAVNVAKFFVKTKYENYQTLYSVEPVSGVDAIDGSLLTTSNATTLFPLIPTTAQA